MSLIRIYIATTEGPVEVLSLSREDPDLRSVACENGRAKALPISRDYDGFIKEPTGVIERAYQHRAFRLDLSHPITNGLSWQLGLFVAHALFQENRLAQHHEEVEIALWLTGEVDRQLNIQRVDHVEEKLRQSQSLFEELRAQDIQLHCFIPSGGFIPSDDLLEALCLNGEFHRLEMVRDLSRIVSFLSLEDPYKNFDPAQNEEDEEGDNDPESPIDLYKNTDENPLKLKENKLLKVAVLGITLLALFGGLYMQFEDNILALRENALHLGIDELRAHPDQGCQTPQKIRLDQQGTHFQSSQTPGLCALDITLNNRGSATHMWAFAQRIDDAHLLLADRETLLSSNPRQGILGWRMVLPDNLTRSIDYRLVGLASDYPLKDAVERMIRHQIENPDLSWDEIEKRLKEQDITVITAYHTLIALRSGQAP